jgi:ADP-heptose:LPS heptosyltransferase
VAGALNENRDVSVFLFGGARDVPVCGRIAGRLKGRVESLAGRTTLPELGGWLQAMDLVIGNDSGPLHMAAAAGTPVLAVLGPTDPVRTGPYGAAHRAITGDAPCRPCRSRVCGREGTPCLSSITPAKVIESALEMLGDAPRRPGQSVPTREV